jgi:FAS-associated factor 2
VDLAKRELRYLLVYLHAPDSGDVDVFCRETLASPELISFLQEERFIVWAGNTGDMEAYQGAFDCDCLSWITL